VRFILIYCFFLLLSVPVLAQTDSLHYDKGPVVLKKFNSKKLDQYKNDKDFQYIEIKREKNFIDKFLEWLGDLFYRFLKWIFGEHIATGLFASIIKAFPYVVVLILLLLILKVFLNVQTESILSGNARKSKINLSEEEEIIKNQDIKELIDKAIADKNYRLAIRYQYLYVLQLLEKKDLIQWEQQKTNHDYEQEINDTVLQNHFRDITYLYDFVWYGNFDINRDNFSKASHIFHSIEQKIKQ